MNWNAIRLNVALVVLSAAVAMAAGCSAPWSPFPAATPTVVPPTATPSPSATPAPVTATYTPAPTLTPVPLGALLTEDPTPTWTPVPGNPQWSLWEYAGLVFRLPVTWRRSPVQAPRGSLYDGPGGPDRPQLLLMVDKVAPDTLAQTYAAQGLDALQAGAAQFKLLRSASFDVGDMKAQRYAYQAQVTVDGGQPRLVQGAAFFAVGDGLALTLQFTADERNAAQWQETFDRIARSVRVSG